MRENTKSDTIGEPVFSFVLSWRGTTAGQASQTQRNGHGPHTWASRSSFSIFAGGSQNLTGARPHLCTKFLAALEQVRTKCSLPSVPQEGGREGGRRKVEGGRRKADGGRQHLLGVGGHHKLLDAHSPRHPRVRRFSMFSWKQSSPCRMYVRVVHRAEKRLKH